MQTWNCTLLGSRSFRSFLASVPRYAVLALNNDLGEHFESLWSNANIRVAADGGANRVFDLLHSQNLKKNPLPDIVKGDLDSLREEVGNFYKGKHVIVTHDKDQDSTDLEKCLQLFTDEYRTFDDPIILCGGLGGNLTHTLANIHSALHYCSKISNQIYLFSDDSIGCILKEGSHTIIGSTDMFCGIIPFGMTGVVQKSSNLKYPPDGLFMSFGKLISTSNQFTSDKVTLETSHPLVFLADARTH